MCLNLSDGYYTWPERKWSPYYIKCQNGRTLPSQCSGASVIYDFVHHNCDLIYSVLNYAYNLSMYFHPPASSLSYLDIKSTEDRRQTTINGISKHTQKPPLIIPSTTYNDLILKTLSILETFSQIQTGYVNGPEFSRYTDNGQTFPSTLENVITTVESKLSMSSHYFQQSSLLWPSYEILETYSKNLHQSKTNEHVNIMTLRETLNKSQIESFSAKHDSVETLLLSGSFMSRKTVEPEFFFATSDVSEQTLQPNFPTVLATSLISRRTVQPSFKVLTESSYIPEQTEQPRSSAVIATNDISIHSIQPSFSAVLASSHMSHLTVQPSISSKTATRSTTEQTEQLTFPAVIATSDLAEQIVQLFPAVIPTSDTSEKKVHHSFTPVTATSNVSEQPFHPSFSVATATSDIPGQTFHSSFPVVVATSNISSRIVQSSLPAVIASSDLLEQTVQRSLLATTATTHITKTVQHSFPAVTVTSDISKQIIQPIDPAVIATSHISEQSVQPSVRAMSAVSDTTEQSVQPSVTAVIVTSDKAEQALHPSFPAVKTTNDISEQTVKASFLAVTVPSDISEQSVQPSNTAVNATSDIAEQTVQPSFLAVNTTSNISEKTFQTSFPAVTATSHVSEQTIQASSPAVTVTRHLSEQTFQPSFTAVTATRNISDKAIQPSFLSVIATCDMPDKTVQPDYNSLIKSKQTAEPSFIALSTANHMSEGAIKPSITAIISTRNVSKPTEQRSFPAVTAIHHSESVEIQSCNSSVGTAILKSIAELSLSDKTLTSSIESVMRETDYSNILPTATPVHVKSESDISGHLPSDIFGHFSKSTLKGNSYKTDKLVTHASQLLGPNTGSYIMSNSLKPSFAIKSSASSQLISSQFESSFDISLVSESTEVYSGLLSFTEIHPSFFPQQLSGSSTHFESSFYSARSKHLFMSSADSSTNSLFERPKLNSKGDEHISSTVQSLKNEPSTLAMTNKRSGQFSSELSKLDSDNLPTVSPAIPNSNSEGTTEFVSFSGFNVYKGQSGRPVVPYSVSKVSTRLVSLVESTSVKYSYSSTSSPSLSEPNTDKTTLIVSFSVTVGGIIVLAIFTALIMCFCKANRQGGASLTEDVDSRLHTIR